MHIDELIAKHKERFESDMTLLTDELREQLAARPFWPDDYDNAQVFAKFFNSDFTWYIVGGKPFPASPVDGDFIFHAFVVYGDDREWGDVTLSQLLEEPPKPMMWTERDRYTELGTVKEMRERGDMPAE
jgi:hypothetical protein